MKLQYKYFLPLFFFICSCANYPSTSKKISDIETKLFNSKGFVLIYNDELFKTKIVNKKINNKKVLIYHKNLKSKTNLILFNPENNTNIKAELSGNASFPSIYNFLISKATADLLKLNADNPYLEINEIKFNKKFIAKKAVTFDEEKFVKRAPTSKISINDISKDVNIVKKKEIKNFKYKIVIGDFYYLDSANDLKKFLLQKNITNLKVIKINSKKYRLISGPYNSFKSLINEHEKLFSLGFDDLDIYK